ncbi:GatB/YqeY domain-containing protein [Virgibacillus oceani]
MTLLEKLNQDMKQAMKNKDKQTLSVIRMVKASIQNEAIKVGNNTLSKDEELNVLSREVKQRKDSLQEFKSAGRDDLVEKTESELHILQEYMPKQLSNEELEKIVQSTIQEVNASSKKDIGKVMSAIMPKVKGKADGAQINKIVQKQLN